VLHAKGDLAAAEAAYREAVRHGPKLAVPRCNLALTLRKKGDLDGAVASLKEALRLEPRNALALRHLPLTVQMRDLLRRLPDVLAGKAEPRSPAETCEFAILCCAPYQKRFAAAARLYQRAFAADPKRAAGFRYFAARAAAASARGEGADAPADGPGRAALRQLALSWLRADLALWRAQAASPHATDRQAAAANLATWLGDPNLAGVREPEALDGLPGEERKLWREFWAGARAALAEAEKSPPPLAER
jgi:tetratricopeptide (TPR) repeat protein